MQMDNITIKTAAEADLPAIWEIHQKAFGYDKEADLTAALLADPTGQPMLSLLAWRHNEALGHILFTRARLESVADAPLTHILAPLAVKPEYQRQGIGGMLIEEGLDRLRAMGSQTVFVLGHKKYYPKYGFKPHAMHAGYPAPYPIPEINSEYWMYQQLTAQDAPRGRVICAAALNAPEHWRDDSGK